MYTIVVADDEEELRRALIRKVDWERIGFLVIGEAENGAEALELVERYAPDLLLTDIRMPFVSGIELARQVREIRPATQIAFLSGFDDFSYAQQAIQYNIVSYMLKPISAAELTEKLKEIRRIIDEKFQRFTSQSASLEKRERTDFLMPLLLDGFGSEAGAEKERRLIADACACGLIRNQDNHFCYTVMVVSIVDEEGRNQTTRASVNAVDLILEKYVKHASFYVEGRVISLLLATRAGFDKYLHIIVEELDQSVKRIMEFSAQIGVSRPVEYLGNTHEAYIEAMNAILYSRRNGICVHYISDVERTEDFDIEKMQASVDEVEKYIRGGSRQELLACLHEMFDRMERQTVSSVMGNFMLVQLVTAVLRIIYAVAEKDVAVEFQKSVPLSVQGTLEGVAEQRGRLIDFCISARDLVAEQRKKSSEVLCDRALELIEMCYMDPDLSLVSISNEISVSSNYLSALIKKSTGSTFVDLLTKKRIQKAREFLLCTNMKIREISERCGYSDQHYFSYCFKKYTGMSPNTCRREAQNNDLAFSFVGCETGGKCL